MRASRLATLRHGLPVPLSRHWLSIYALAFVLLLAGRGIAAAQKNHAAGHASYMSWVNGNGHGCCNNQDCGALADGQEQEINGRLHVFVRGVGVAKGQSEWCPVLPFP